MDKEREPANMSNTAVMPDHYKTKSSRMANTRAWWPSSKTVSVMDSSSSTPSTSFRVFNWNILALQFVDMHRYLDTDGEVLCWANRVHAILAEILAKAPDIITLQEMNQNAYELTFCSALGERGYKGVFVPKTFSQCAEIDGVATFWKTKRFRCLEDEAVKFSVDKILNRPQVASVVMLEDTLYPEERLIVSNTHLLFNLKRGDVKLGQLQLLMSAVWRMVERWSVHRRVPFGAVCSHVRDAENVQESARELGAASCGHLLELHGQSPDRAVTVLTKTPGILMCGDYNVTPNSCIYEWIRSGRFDFTHISNKDIGTLSGQQMMLDRSYKIDEAERDGRGTAPTYLKICTEQPPYSSHSTAFGKPHRSDSAVLSSMSKGTPKRARTTAGFLPQANPIQESLKSALEAGNSWLSKIMLSTDTSLFTKPPVLWVSKDVLHYVLEEKSCSAVKKTSRMSTVASDSAINIKKRCDHSFASTLASGSSETAFSSGTLYHPFWCRSAYARNFTCTATNSDTGRERAKEPAFTAYHGWQRGCIDYIWYSPNELQVSRTFELPRVDELRHIKGIPHPIFPGSDHFSLVAEFCWTPCAERHVAALLY